MNSVKVAVALACSILISLLALLVFTKKPEKELYDKAVEMVMAHGELDSAEEVMKHCPELKNIQRKMDRISLLNSNLHSLTGGPSPNVSENQSEEILAITEEIQILRLDVKKELIGLMETYERGHQIKIASVGN